MKAILYNRKAPGRLLFTEVDKPVPADNEVMIKIHAASVNALDYRSMKLGIIPKKKIFGADVAGTITETGKNIKHFKPGDEIVADLFPAGSGGFAEFAIAPEHILAGKPPALSFENAAALPAACTTALQALRNIGKVKKGQKVLIVGSGGGVGTYAVQLAKYFEAEVTAVCGTQNVSLSASLGANHVIDYTKEDFTRSSEKYDLILAINGNYSLLSYKKLLMKKGRYVMVGGALSQVFKSLVFGRLLSLGNKKMLFLAARSNRKDLEYIVQLAAEGKIKPVIDRTFTLEQTPEAFQYMNQGHVKGKVIIQIA